MKIEYFEKRSKLENLEKANHKNANWLHIQGGNLRVQEIADQYALDANIVRDISDIRELSRAEFSDGIEYIFIRLPIGSVDAARTAPLLIILSESQIITINVYADFRPEAVDKFLTSATDRASAVVPAIIATGLVEYEQKLREIIDKIAVARKRLSRYEVENSDFVEFVAIEDSLNEYRSSLDGVASVVTQLQDNNRKLFKPQEIEQFIDISLHIRQLLVAIDSSNQTINSIQNAYSTIANNVLNQRMKLLTIITIMLAIPNVFYGMYGMNLALPFQHEPWAYAGIVGLTVLLILIVYTLAKRFRLL